ncbi:MAG: hypothetical protein DRN59_00600 [Thaumarchaeota archaeon]|nr:MAG: hypothetical protein DRN59_00600 [Nitrososphaerota archaeon]
MDRSSAVVYIRSGRIGGYERGLARIGGKPMIEYVLDALPDEVDDLVIAVENGGNAEAYNEVADKYFAQIIPSGKLNEGARKFVEFAVNNVHGDRVVILPGDAPLITRDFATFLLECSKRFTAALPRTPARKATYLMASYQTKPFREMFTAHPEADMEEIVRRVGKAVYLSSISLKIFDERLGMFFRVSSVQDLRKAEKILKTRKKTGLEII